MTDVRKTSTGNKGAEKFINSIAPEKNHNEKSGLMVYLVYQTAESLINSDNFSVDQLLDHKKNGFFIRDYIRIFWDNPDSGLIDQLDQLDQLDHIIKNILYEYISRVKNLPLKNKILLVLLKKEMSFKEISTILKKSIDTIQKTIIRTSRKTGLFYDGLVDEILSEPKKWKITNEGYDYIKNLLVNELHSIIKEKINDFFAEKRKIDIKYKTLKIEEFLESYWQGENKDLIIDFADLAKELPEIADELLEEPEEMLKLFELAYRKISYQEENKEITVRFKNFPKSEEHTIGELRKDHLNKLVVVRGLVAQRGEPHPKVSVVRYQCPSCGEIYTVVQTEKILKEPKLCSCGRKGRMNVLDRELRDVQYIILEELGSDLFNRSQPEQIAIELYDGLTNPSKQHLFNPGETIKVIGVLKGEEVQAKGGKKTEMRKYIIANNVEGDADTFRFNIVKSDEEKIKEISKNNPLKQLTESFAPNIYTIQGLKESLLLASVLRPSNAFKFRTYSHILMIGDPGLGKTSLMIELKPYIHRARFISGEGASGVGLLGSAVKDERLGWMLKAGEVVLAAGSILFVDEFDKFKEKEDLHSVMESGIVTLAKASIHATMKSETAIIASANPKHGRFDEYEDFFSQIDLNPALLTRFDLIWFLRDKRTDNYDDFVIDSMVTTREKPIGDELFAKYLYMAKHFSEPQFAEGVVEYIKQIYKRMRQMNFSDENGKGKRFIVVPRHAQAIIRLAMAHAKLRFSKTIEKEDVDIAQDLFMKSIATFGKFSDLERYFMTGVTESDLERQISILVMSALQPGVVLSYDDIFSYVAENTTVEIKDEILKKVLDNLKKMGDIYEPKSGRYQKM